MKYVVVRGNETTDPDLISIRKVIGYDTSIGDKVAETCANQRLTYEKQKGACFIVVENDDGTYSEYDKRC